MSDLTITTAGVSESKVSGGEFLSGDKKLNQMKVDIIELSPGVTTNECSDGEIIFDNEKIENCVGVKGGSCILQSVTILDDDDIGTAVDLVFLSATGSLGTEGGAISVDDAASAVPGTILGVVNVSNYMDGVNWKLGHKENIGLVLKAAADSRDIYVACINRGGTNQTWGATDLHLKFGIIQD
tara:strand:+ start:50 stop:598 length:549 start_codon:yes stop_codon:yes gene_type:complete